MVVQVRLPPHNYLAKMAKARSPSPEATNVHLQKRLKISHSPSTSGHFAPGLLEESSIHSLRTSYANSEPFKFGVIEKLFQDELLRGVKDECLNELSFTEKETDIYKASLKLVWINDDSTAMCARSIKRATLLHFPISRMHNSNCSRISSPSAMRSIHKSSASSSELSSAVVPSRGPNRICL